MFGQFSWVDQLVAASGPPVPNSSSVGLIARVIAIAVARGARRPILLDAIGVDDINGRNQLSRLPGEVLVRLFHAIEQELATPSLALKMGRAAGPRCFSDLGYATRFLPRLADVLNANIRLQALRQNLYHVSLDDSDNRASLRWNLREHDAQEMAPLIEFSVSSYARLAREIWWDDTQIRSISLQHRPRYESAEYAQQLGCPIIFGAPFTAIELSAAQLTAPSPMANARLTAAIRERQAMPMTWFDNGHRLSAMTYFNIYTELHKFPVTLHRLARCFGMNERTLRRKLAGEGRPLRDLLDQVRRHLCDLYQIEGQRSFGEIAELLGYGEISAFSRAATRWYGTAPSRYWKDIERENGGRSKD